MPAAGVRVRTGRSALPRLIGAPILVTPFVAGARGDVAGWGVTGPVGLVTLASLGLFATLLSARPVRFSPVELEPAPGVQCQRAEDCRCEQDECELGWM